MRLNLPDVTLVAIDCAAHDLTRLAIEDTLREIVPAAVLLFSDRPFVPEAGWIECHNNSVADRDRVLWHIVPQHVRTSHYLTVQWDGWVVDAGLWESEFLSYDYIGAPWPWHESGRRVGNGGFSLRSACLGRFLAEHQQEYPIEHPEDEALCRLHRARLEREGFRWAPEDVAARFSLEHGDIRPTFGFHDCRNFPRLLDREAIAKRLAAANDYVRQKDEWRGMMGELSFFGVMVPV
jgi:hypothetical protein